MLLLLGKLEIMKTGTRLGPQCKRSQTPLIPLPIGNPGVQIGKKGIEEESDKETKSIGRIDRTDRFLPP